MSRSEVTDHMVESALDISDTLLFDFLLDGMPMSELIARLLGFNRMTKQCHRP
jgi:hypothetical protein